MLNFFKWLRANATVSRFQLAFPRIRIRIPTMQTPMPTPLYRACPGCQNPYPTWTGFWSHMRQSRNPLCQAARRRLEESMNPPSSQSSNNSLESSGDDETAMPFEGDFFGTARDYDGDNFGQLEDGHTDSNHEDSNSGLDEGLDHDAGLDQRLFEFELEDSLEPNRECRMDSNLESDMESDSDSNLRDIRLASQRLAAEERADSHPQIVRYSDHYPSSRPGFIVSCSSTSGDSAYTASVDGKKNLWAPFTSEIDWKVARWAKLRGPGSTAFSDLLAIDGVYILASFLVQC